MGTRRAGIVLCSRGLRAAPRMIYLDHNATTPLEPAALDEMLPHLRQDFGNPSSAHRLGEEAAAALERARGRVARLVGASGADEIVFTSGGTESANSAIASALRARAGRRRIVASAVEHAAVLQPLERAAREGCELELVGVDGEGRLALEHALRAIDERCALVSLIAANNETGVLLEPEALAAIGQACARAGALLHLDAVQLAGKLPLELARGPADCASISAHKFGGPKGAGALWLRRGGEFHALLVGGGQERERRAGTPNVAAIAGMGRAAELARAWLAQGAGPARLTELRTRLELGLLGRVPGAELNAARAARLPNTASIRFPGLQAEALQMLLDAQGVAVSTGSACGSRRRAPSHVLLAMGRTREAANQTLRFSLGRGTNDADVDGALELVAAAAAQLRALAPAEPA